MERRLFIEMASIVSYVAICPDPLSHRYTNNPIVDDRFVSSRPRSTPTRGVDASTSERIEIKKKKEKKKNQFLWMQLVKYTRAAISVDTFAEQETDTYDTSWP